MTIEAGPDELYTTLARVADVPALAQLVNGAYRAEGGRGGWTTERELVAGPRVDAAAIEAMIGAPGHALLVLRAQSGLFACAAVAKLGDGVAGLGLLAVRPALQGNGLGRQMLAAAERYVREHYRAARMEVEVLAGREELLAWAERRGYRPSGETRPFRDDGRWGAPQQAGLTLQVLGREIAPAP